jgi:predicted nucleic acid-binding protein
VPLGVLDAGVAIGWIVRRHRSLPRIERLFDLARAGRVDLVLSVVNLAEVLIHTVDAHRATGVDPVAVLRAAGVRLHPPDEAIARRVARLRASIADAFAAATALELGGRLHTADRELVRRLRSSRVAVTAY